MRGRACLLAEHRAHLGQRDSFDTVSDMSLEALAGARDELFVSLTISTGSNTGLYVSETHLVRHDKHQGSSICSRLSDFSHSHDIPTRSFLHQSNNHRDAQLIGRKAHSGMLRPGRYLTFSCFSLKTSTSERPSCLSGQPVHTDMHDPQH